MNVRDLYRKTKPVLTSEMKSKLDELNNKEVPNSVENEKIPEIASEYISSCDY